MPPEHVPRRRVAFQDYYEALEVPRDASEDEVRQAYRRLARRYHLDVNKEPGAEDRFKQISEAYEVLRDPEKPERYDRLGANWRAGQDVSGAAGFGDGFDAGNGFGDARVEFGGGDFSDFFESFFDIVRAGQPDGRASRASRCAAATTRRCSIWGSRKPPGEEAAAVAGRRALGRGPDPAWRTRRPADLGGRTRQCRRRRRAVRRPVPPDPAQAPPALPRRRRRSVRRSPGLAMGGGARRGRFRCRRSTVKRPRSRFRRAHPAAASSGFAARACPAAEERRRATCMPL